MFRFDTRGKQALSIASNVAPDKPLSYRQFTQLVAQIASRQSDSPDLANPRQQIAKTSESYQGRGALEYTCRPFISDERSLLLAAIIHQVG
jgi:hypothetical protein